MSQLEDLLQQCTVKLSLSGRMGWGTGFFVAPGWILTCAHVVQAAKDEPLQVRWQKQENWAQAVVERSLPEPYDLALLRLTSPPDAADPPCVYLDTAIQSRDPLYLFGYPDQDFPNGCPVTFSCEGLTGDEPALIKFALGQVRPGMSGSPLLNQRTGKVCGIVKFTRDRAFDLGGGAVPAAVMLAQFPELVTQQRVFHQNDQRWRQHMEGAIALNPTTLLSTRATLSLSAYDAATWIGREALVATLTQKLENGCRILALTGITGIGKTALAECLVVARQGNGVPFHRLNFDDRGQGRDFLSSALALLPKLGETVTAEDQKEPQNALNHLLHTLRHQPFLVQIDSLEMLLQGDEQSGWNAFADSLWVDFFQQLLAGETCQSQLLLTTQALSDELEIVGSNYPRYWHRQDLEGLSESEQLQLFEKNGLTIDPAGTETLKQLGRLYQGHPLVIQVIAKDILEKPFHGNVQQYWRRYQAEFDEMARHRQKGSSPRALQLRVKQRVEQSLKRLSSDALQMLCHSAVYRRPVPEAFWLVMVGTLPDDQQWAALELLKGRNLAEEELRTDGVLLLRQHNLVKSVAYRLLRLDEAAWREAECAAARAWLHNYTPEPEAPNLEQLRGKLEAFYQYCEVAEWEAAKAILLDQGVGVQLYDWGYFREMLPLYGRLLGTLGDAVDLACKSSLGKAYLWLSNYRQAIEYFQQSLTLARVLGDRQEEVRVLGNLGRAHVSLGLYQQSMADSQQQLTIAREMGDQLGEGAALSNLGNAHWQMGHYPQAIEYNQAALTIARRCGDRKGEALALSYLGHVHRSLGDHAQAIEYDQQSLAVAQAAGDRWAEERALGGLGFSYQSLGQPQQAIAYFQQQLPLARILGDRLGEGLATGLWGVALLRLEHYAEAQQQLHTALEIFQQLSFRRGEAEAYLRLGELHYQTGQRDLAREFGDRALAIAAELGIPLLKECEAFQAKLAADASRG